MGPFQQHYDFGAGLDKSVAHQDDVMGLWPSELSEKPETVSMEKIDS